jgi:hypothetical protein
MSPSAYQAWRKQADAEALNRSQEVRDDVTAVCASVIPLWVFSFRLSLCLVSLFTFILSFLSLFLFLFFLLRVD